MPTQNVTSRKRILYLPESLVTRRVAKVHQTSCHPGQLPQFHHHAHLSEKIQSWAPHAIHLTIDLWPWYLFCDLAAEAPPWMPMFDDPISWHKNQKISVNPRMEHQVFIVKVVMHLMCLMYGVSLAVSVACLETGWWPGLAIWHKRKVPCIAVMVWQPELTCF